MRRSTKGTVFAAVLLGINLGILLSNVTTYSRPVIFVLSVIADLIAALCILPYLTVSSFSGPYRFLKNASLIVPAFCHWGIEEFHPPGQRYMPLIHMAIFLVEYLLISVLGSLAPFQETEAIQIPSGFTHAELPTFAPTPQAKLHTTV